MSEEAKSFPQISIAQITTLITLCSTAIALVVSYTNYTDSRTKEELSLRKAFRDNFQSEEDYWSNLSNEYLAIYAAGSPQNEEWRTRKLAALRSLSNRPIPEFSEFRDLDYNVEPYSKRLENMQIAFKFALDPQLPNEIANEFRVADFQAAAARTTSEAAPSTPPKPGSQIVFSGSKTGWDIDFFWCTTPGDKDREARNYTAALTTAGAFANFAKGGGSLLPGTPLGRLRLSSRDNVDLNGAFSQTGRWLVRDGTSGESEVADAIAKLASSSDARKFAVAPNGGSETPYYTSVFFCEK